MHVQLPGERRLQRPHRHGVGLRLGQRSRVSENEKGGNDSSSDVEKYARLSRCTHGHPNLIPLLYRDRIKSWVRGLVKLIPAVAYHFSLN